MFSKIGEHNTIRFEGFTYGRFSSVKHYLRWYRLYQGKRSMDETLYPKHQSSSDRTNVGERTRVLKTYRDGNSTFINIHNEWLASVIVRPFF